MNKVKHRPQGQDYSQWAGEEKKQAYSVVCSLTSLHFLQSEGNCQPKTAVVWTNIIYLFENLNCLSAGSAVRDSVSGCCWYVFRQARTKSAFSRVQHEEKQNESCLLMSLHKPSCVLNMLAWMGLL